ncbi:PE domain-containing protein [Mycobacterium angelicum]|uniref:PE domain-containing protein n=1 Tax=Mycobacterium angelicum TaxID=470074 RepID=UPI0014759E19|nr:PE domain-containing protein [Mycobacterium angelicum]MCV7200188.1 PE domain-containing protein [Mycobacterium angelicum]
MITQVETEALLAGVVDVVSNAATTASVVAGGAPAGIAPAPAGADEASALASMNTSVHTAEFLATAAQGTFLLGHYAGTLGITGLGYEVVDDGNAAMLA